MSGKGSQLPLFTSPDLVEGNAPNTAGGIPFTTCDVRECNGRCSVFFDPAVVRASLIPVIFKDSSDDHLVGTCQKHYGQIRYRHGTDLAYKIRGGKVRAYVKDVWI